MYSMLEVHAMCKWLPHTRKMNGDEIDCDDILAQLNGDVPSRFTEDAYDGDSKRKQQPKHGRGADIKIAFSWAEELGLNV